MLKVRQIRLEKGLSVPKLVELTGLSRRTIQNIEKSGSCTIANAYKLATALGVTLNDVYTPDENGEE